MCHVILSEAKNPPSVDGDSSLATLVQNDMGELFFYGSLSLVKMPASIDIGLKYVYNTTLVSIEILIKDF